MAIYRYNQKPVHFFYKVFWLILSIVYGADSGFMKNENGIERSLFISNLNNFRKFKRSTVEEPLQIPKNKNNTNLSGIQGEIGSVQVDKYNKMYDNPKQIGKVEEHSKSSNKGKYVESEHKNFNHNNKFGLEKKHVALNESEKFKSETLISHEQNLNSTNNKDKLSYNLSEVHFNFTNSTIPKTYTLENKKDKLASFRNVSSNTALEEVKVNETHLMSDQPLKAIENDVSNNTNTNVDDSFEVNNQNSSDTHNDTTADDHPMDSLENMNILLISGISLGSVVVLSLIAGGGYVIYRHRIWNKPQTLSDKCSNADSSGYIDDSTLRENSEEMYSLDNDSFLNSLEAMTIQNYWTDNVKHTKL